MSLLRASALVVCGLLVGANGGCDDDTAGQSSNDGGPGLDAGTADATIPILTDSIAFNFQNGAESFAVDTYANVGPYTDGNPQNIGGVPNGAAPPTLAFDPDVGMPTPGSLSGTATFTDYNQTLTVRRAYPASDTINLSGRVVTAQIRLEPGSSPFTGIVHLMALSSPSPPRPAPGYFFAQGSSIRLTDNEWHTLTFDLSAPEFAANGFDASDIVQIGVQLASGAPPPGTPGAPTVDAGPPAPADAGAAPDAAPPVPSTYGPPQSLTFHFDSQVSN